MLNIGRFDVVWPTSPWQLRGLVGDGLSEFIHADVRDVTSRHLPLVVCFDDHCSRGPRERGRVGEDLNDVTPAFDLLLLSRSIGLFDQIFCQTR